VKSLKAEVKESKRKRTLAEESLLDLKKEHKREYVKQKQHRGKEYFFKSITQGIYNLGKQFISILFKYFFIMAASSAKEI
jgi:hypothetical protein